MRLPTARRKFTEGDTFNLYFFSDQHRGNANADKRAMCADRDEIAADPTGIVILGGDSHECISKKDPRFDESHVDWSIASPLESKHYSDAIVRDRTEFFRPIASQILVDLGGNHEEKYGKVYETDIRLRSLENLKRADAWVPGQAGALVRIVFTDPHRHTCQLIINAQHGRRTGKNKASLLKLYLDKLSNHWDGVDLLVRGHCHWRGADDRLKLTANANHTRLHDKRIFAGLMGGYLKSYKEDGQSYAEDWDLDPMDIGMLKMTVTPSRQGCTLSASC